MASKLVVAEHPKAPEEVEAIRAVLKDNFLFAHLDAATVGKVAMAMFQVEYKAGDVIIRQGADGDNFYVVAAGTCKCYVGSCDEVGLVSICGAGDGYGELSLMYDAPRAASVIADTDVVLWALDRSSFTVLLMQSAMDKRSAHRDFLDSVDVLTRLSAYDKMTIADAVSPVNYQDGDRIIEEGAPGEFVAIVAEGQVAISMANRADEVCRLRRGDYFGEVAVLKDQPRLATATALGEATCLLIPAEAFRRIAGSLRSTLHKRMEEVYKLTPSESIPE